MDVEERNQRTAALARQIWEAEGRPDGQEHRHWQMAGRLVQADLAASRVGDADADADVEAGCGTA